MNLPIVLKEGSIYHTILKIYACIFIFLLGDLLKISTKNGASYGFNKARMDLIAGLYSSKYSLFIKTLIISEYFSK